mgnify:CR=1 FL=1
MNSTIVSKWLVFIYQIIRIIRVSIKINAPVKGANYVGVPFEPSTSDKTEYFGLF